MTDLNSQTCVPCKGGDPQLSREQIDERLPQLESWEVVTADDVPRLRKSFRFRNFREALAFSNQIGAIAEEQGHHPRIVTEWGRVTVEWWTHKIRGLHDNDFIMAAKTDAIGANG